MSQSTSTTSHISAQSNIGGLNCTTLQFGSIHSILPTTITTVQPPTNIQYIDLTDAIKQHNQVDTLELPPQLQQYVNTLLQQSVTMSQSHDIVDLTDEAVNYTQPVLSSVAEPKAEYNVLQHSAQVVPQVDTTIPELPKLNSATKTHTDSKQTNGTVKHESNDVVTPNTTVDVPQPITPLKSESKSKSTKSPHKSTKPKKLHIQSDNTTGEYTVERIVSHRLDPKTNTLQYEVKWTGYNDTTWQTPADLKNNTAYEYYIKHFNTQQARFSSATRSEMEQITVDKFNTELEQFLQTYSVDTIDTVQLTQSEQPTMTWQQLSARIRYLYNNHLLHTVQIDLLQQLQLLLVQQLKQGKSIQLLDINTYGAIDYNNEVTIDKSIYCADIALYIFTTVNISRTLMNDKLLSNLIQFISHCINDIVLVAYDTVFRSKHKSNTVHRNDIISSKKSNNTDIEQSPSKDDKSIDAYWRAVQKHIAKYKSRFSNLLEQFSHYFINESTIDDEYQRLLLECCMNVIQCDNVTDMQYSVHILLQSMFVNTDINNKKSILNDIILVWKSIPPNKKNLRSYKLSHARTYNKNISKTTDTTTEDTINPAVQANAIQPLTALIIQLLQSLPAANVKDTELLKSVHSAIADIDSDATTQTQNTKLAIDIQARTQFCTNVITIYDITAKLSWHFITNFVMQLQPSTVNALTLTSMRDTIKNFIYDLLCILYLPEYPVSILLLQQLLLFFSHIIRGTTEYNEFNSDKLREFVINEIGHIAVELQQNYKSITKYPLIVRKRPVYVDTTALPTSENEIIDCNICGMYSRNGITYREPQVDTLEEADTIKKSMYFDCDSCHIWLHGKCYGYTVQTDIPERWICESCTLQQQITVQKQQATRRLQRLVSNKALLQESPELEYIPDIDTTVSDATVKNEITNEVGQVGIMLSTDVLKQIIINYMTVHSLNDTAQHAARQYMLTVWLFNALKLNEAQSDDSEDTLKSNTLINIDQLDHTDVIFCLAEWQLMDTTQIAQSSVLSRDIVIQAIKQLLIHNTLIQTVKPVTQLLLNACNEKQGKLRAAAVKSLSELIALDSSLLAESNAARILYERLNDDSTMTRAAIVSMIASLITSGKYEYFDRFYDKLIEKTNDTGISVRKKIYELFVYVLQNYTTLKMEYKIVILKLLIQKCFVEDTNLHIYIVKTIRNLFFSTDNIVIRNRYTIDKSATGTTYTVEYTQLVELIVRLIANLNQHDTENFTDILNLLIELNSNTALTEIDPRLIQSIKQDRKKNINKHINDNNNNTIDIISQYIVCMIEQIITLQTNDFVHIYPLMTALNFFALFKPQLFVAHIITLKPYLITAHSAVRNKDTEKSMKQHAYLVAISLISVYERCIPLYEHKCDDTHIHEILNILLDIVMYTIQNDLIRCSITCLCKIVSTVKYEYSTHVFELIGKFYAILVNSLNTIKPTDALRGNLLKSMFALGHLVKNFDIDKYIQQHSNAYTALNILPSEQFTDKLYELYIAYINLNVNNSEYMLFSFYGIITLIEKQPQYINHTQSQAVFSRVLSSNNNAAVLYKVLRAIKEFLYDNEIVQKDDKTDDTDDTTVQIKVQQNKKWENSHFQISDYLPIFVSHIETEIYNLLYYNNIQIRYECIQIIVFLITQNITNPKQSVTMLLTVTTDYDTTVANLAYDSVIKYLNSKKTHINLIYQNLIPAIKQMYTFHTTVYSDIFNPLQLQSHTTQQQFKYTHIVTLYDTIKTNVVLRKSFIKQYIHETINLVYSNKLQTSDTLQSPLKQQPSNKNSNKLQLLVLMCTILSQLNFTDDEPLVLLDALTAPCVELDTIVNELQINLHSIAKLTNTHFIDVDDEFDRSKVITHMSYNDLVQQTIYKCEQTLYYTVLIQFKNYILQAYGLNTRVLNELRNNNRTGTSNKLNKISLIKNTSVEYKLESFPFTKQSVTKPIIVEPVSATKSPNKSAKKGTKSASKQQDTTDVTHTQRTTIPIDELYIQQYYFACRKMDENEIPPGNIMPQSTRKGRRGDDDESLTSVSPSKSTAKKRPATKRRKYDESEDSDESSDDSEQEIVKKSPNKKKPKAKKPKKRSKFALSQSDLEDMEEDDESEYSDD